MDIASRIFKAYDIRGVVDDTLTESAVYAIARAFAQQMQESALKTAVTGRDGRLSSPRLHAALNAGLVDCGVDVIDIGLATTPMMYFATHHLGTGTGVQVTGSHNPPDYNGLKLMAGGHTLHGDAVQDLRQRVQAMDAGMVSQTHWAKGSANGSTTTAPIDADARQRCGRLQTRDIAAAYRDVIAKDIRLARPMKIAIDAGNGVAGAFAGDLFRAIGCTVTELFCEVDGRFPNHHPDPSRAENLQALQACLAEGAAEIGLAFDGDADRLGVVTRDGHIIDADRLMMLFAPDVLQRHPGASILFDVKCSRRLAQTIAQAGGVPLMWKTGHSMLKAKLRETGAPLAGEMSGHLFFSDRWYGFDDGLYAGARLLELLSRQADASLVLDALPDSISTPEIQVSMADGETHALVERLVQAVGCGQIKLENASTVSTVDGLRIDYADGFGLVRASNTTPVLTLRFEADTALAMARIQTHFRTLIHAVSPDVALPF